MTENRRKRNKAGIIWLFSYADMADGDFFIFSKKGR